MVELVLIEALKFHFIWIDSMFLQNRKNPHIAKSAMCGGPDKTSKVKLCHIHGIYADLYYIKFHGE